MINPDRVYAVWYENDLLPFDPPKRNEAYKTYVRRIGKKKLSQDPLFSLVLAALCQEDLVSEEIRRRLRRMISVLDELHDALT
jgi:hypothetical protein